MEINPPLRTIDNTAIGVRKQTIARTYVFSSTILPTFVPVKWVYYRRQRSILVEQQVSSLHHNQNQVFTPDTSDLVQSIGCVNRGETGAGQRQLAQLCIN